MHPQAYRWVAAHANELGPPRRVLDLGGALRPGAGDLLEVRALFPAAATYLTVDLDPSADCRADARYCVVSPETWDVVVSTETLEHCPGWWELVYSAALHVRPGGLVLMTCASRDRAPHSAEGKGRPPAPGEHYSGVSAVDLRVAAELAGLRVLICCEDPEPCDTYLAAVRPGLRAL